MRGRSLSVGFFVWVWMSGLAFAVDNTNLPGNDYANFDAPSARLCRATCGGESDCKAYTWAKPGIPGASGRCWLKSALPAIVRDRCCDSGPRDFISARDLQPEDKTDRPGSDYKNFAIDGRNGWTQCEAACKAEADCHSWTYARPGAQGPQARCWLKREVARPVQNARMVSGVKYRLPSVRFD